MSPAKGGKAVRVFAGAVVVMVAAVIATGLYVAGSPGSSRGVRLDEQRVSDLEGIASAVDQHYARTGQLPSSLDVFTNDPQGPYFLSATDDPATGLQYDYQATGASTYNVCAVFDQATPAADGTTSAPTPARPASLAVYGQRSWEHPAGRHCFALDAKDSLPRRACGLQNPCQAGSVCAALPGEQGPVCVPKGAECAAAGCKGSCTVSGDYPVTVSCTAAAPTDEAPSCVLMRDASTGSVDCFGCANGVCRNPPSGWKAYAPTAPKNGVSVPYSCYTGPGGCELAQ